MRKVKWFASLAILSSFCLAAQGPLPPIADYEVFVAKPPYYVAANNRLYRVKLGIYGTRDDIERGFEFVENFANSSTQRINAQSVQTPVLSHGGIVFRTLVDADLPAPGSNFVTGRVEKDTGTLKIAYLAGDPPSAEKCRSMINTWPIPSQRELLWDLSFKAGDAEKGEVWPLFPSNLSPVLIWQVKAEPGRPSMAISLDTDDRDRTKLRLKFLQRQFDTPESILVADVGGLQTGTYVDVMMKAVLDDREPAQGGQGYWSIWVNGKPVGSFQGRTLRQNMEPHRWAFGVYMYTHSKPTSFSRITYWRRAAMLVPKSGANLRQK